MKPRALILAASGLFALVLVVPQLVAAADTPFVPIVPLPFPVNENAGLGPYLNGLFGIAISLSAGLAVVMVVIGGLQYMVSDVVGDKAKGRQRIQGAIIGLILLLASWLILYVINPCLLELDPLGSLGSGSRRGCQTPASSTGADSSGLRNPANAGLGGQGAPGGGAPGGGTAPGGTAPGGSAPGAGSGGNGAPGGGTQGGAGGSGGNGTAGSGGQGAGTGASGNPPIGAASSYAGTNLVPSGMALMCFAGPCPTSFTSESLSFPNKLPFPELSGPEAQAACGGNPNVQSACVYGDARWLQNQGVEALLQMNQVNICDGTNGGWQFRMTDETLNCSQTAQICTVKRVYRTLNGFPPGECTLVPAPTI